MAGSGHGEVRMVVAGCRTRGKQLRADRDVPGAPHPALGAPGVRLGVDRRPLLRLHKEKSEGFLEGWTTLTWLAAKIPDVMLCHHVLGHGYRNPALLAKMASTLQVLSGGRF